MGRISTIPDTKILDSIRMIDSGEISLRARAKQLDMAHTSLMKRIKKIRDYWEENNIPESKRYGIYSNKIEGGSLKTTTHELKTTTNQDRKKLDNLNNRLENYEKSKIKLRTDLPFRKMPNAKEFSGHDYFKLDIEMLRTWYRLVTGRQDKSKGGKASNIESLIPAIIEGLEYNYKFYQRKAGIE